MGDIQCSVYATIESPNDAVLNVSTSAQLAFVVEDYVATSGPAQSSPVQYIPYFDGAYLAVAATLNGGNALATFVRMLQQWTLQLGFPVTQCESKTSFSCLFYTLFYQPKFGSV